MARRGEVYRGAHLLLLVHLLLHHGHAFAVVAHSSPPRCSPSSSPSTSSPSSSSRAGVALRRSPLHASAVHPASSAALLVPRLRGGGGPVAGGLVAATAGAGLGRDVACALFGLVGATLWLKLWTILAARGAVDPKLSRKVVHSGSAPLFMLTWPFFSGHPRARYVAALVPTAFMCRLLLARQGKQPELVKAISRSGDSKEATGGPFLYVLVLIATTLVAWRDSLISVVAISEMALGDGLADIVGRRFGKTGKWPAFFAKGGGVQSKSYAGSAAFAAGGFLGSLGLAAWFAKFGCLNLAGFTSSSPAAAWLSPAPHTGSLVAKVAVLSLVTACVELLPLGDDNLTVPAAAAALTAAFLGGGQAAGFALAGGFAAAALLLR